MVATPYTLKFLCRHVGGQTPGKPQTVRAAADDVAGNRITWTDLGATEFYEPPPYGLEIVDILSSAAGVDTADLQLRKNTADEEVYIGTDLLADKTIDAATRCQDLRGRKFMPGNKYAFTQRA